MITVVSFSVKIDFNLKIASQMLDLVNHSTTTDLLEISSLLEISQMSSIAKLLQRANSLPPLCASLSVP